MRKHAATVPASKAKIGTVYAVRHDGELTRFRVVKVTTSRISDSGSPHDYESEITGDFIFTADDEGRLKTERATISPNKLLGQFEEYKELVAKKDAEAKAAENRAKQERKDARDLLEMLYRVAGIPLPRDVTGFDSPFRLSGYGGHTPDIGRAGVKPLLDGLRKLVGEADLAHSANLVDEKVDG